MKDNFKNWEEINRYELKDAIEKQMELYDARRSNVQLEIEKIRKDQIEPRIHEKIWLNDKRNELCKQLQEAGFIYNWNTEYWDRVKEEQQ